MIEVEADDVRTPVAMPPKPPLAPPKPKPAPPAPTARPVPKFMKNFIIQMVHF